MTKRTILLILQIILSSSLRAQPAPAENETMATSGRIKGTIIDSETMQPMEYANIAIFDRKDSSLVTGGITNKNGQFDIGGLGYGEYYAEAIFIGYEKTSMPAIKILPANQVIDLGKVTLSASTMELEAVNVVAERQRIEYRVDKKVINVSQDINAAGGTAVDVLENTPSVEVDIDGNVMLRGSSSFTVLIDGKPSVLSGSDALRQLPASVIENIEIITNPSAKYDPDGMAGIINVVMKKNILSGFNGIINAMIGTRDKYRSDLTLNYRTGKSNLFFGADWSEDNSYGNFYSERETYRNDTTSFLIADGRRDFGRDGFNIRAGADLFLSDMATLTISGTAGENGSDRNGGSTLHEYTLPATIDKYMVNDNISRREGTQFSTNISFQQKFNAQGTHKIDALLYISGRNSDDSESQDEYLSNQSYSANLGFSNQIKTQEDDRSSDYRLKIDYVKPLSEEGKLEAGVQSTINRESEDFFFTNFDPVSDTWINNPLYTSSFDFTRDIHAGYLTWSAKSGPAQYMAGLRGEYTFRETDHEKAPEPFRLTRFDLFPSGHISFDAGKSTQIMTSYSRRISRPSGRDLDPFPGYLNQYTIRTGNPELKPQYTSSYELGLIQRFGSSFISVETFYRTTNNLISQVQELREDGIFYLTSANINRDYSLGTEVMGNFNLTRWFLLNSSISLFNYRIKGELNSQNIDRESTNYSARINGTFRLAADSRVQLTAYYRGPSVQAQGESKGMFFSNLSYRQEFFARKLTATLSLRDILGSMRFENMSYGPDFRNKFRMERESRVVQLTLSYKINNYKQDRNNGDMGGGDNGMRMDMDF